MFKVLPTKISTAQCYALCMHVHICVCVCVCVTEYACVCMCCVHNNNIYVTTALIANSG